MRLKYFADTDTLHMILTDDAVAETRNLNENILIDLDKDGKVVSMTIEHARQQSESLDVSYQTVSASSSSGGHPFSVKNLV